MHCASSSKAPTSPSASTARMRSNGTMRFTLRETAHADTRDYGCQTTRTELAAGVPTHVTAVESLAAYPEGDAPIDPPTTCARGETPALWTAVREPDPPTFK